MLLTVVMIMKMLMGNEFVAISNVYETSLNSTQVHNQHKSAIYSIPPPGTSLINKRISSKIEMLDDGRIYNGLYLDFICKSYFFTDFRLGEHLVQPGGARGQLVHLQGSTLSVRSFVPLSIH